MIMVLKLYRLPAAGAGVAADGAWVAVEGAGTVGHAESTGLRSPRHDQAPRLADGRSAARLRSGWLCAGGARGAAAGVGSAASSLAKTKAFDAADWSFSST